MDVYITDTPLVRNLYPGLSELRKSCRAYRMPDKLDITMYTLASYAMLKWSGVIVKYELEDDSRREEFEKFVLGLFPGAKLIYGRSDSQEKFLESLEMIESSGDEWVFWAANNDHPFIAADTGTLDACMAKARELKEENRFVSVVYSHFTETVNVARPGTPIHMVTPNAPGIVEEDGDCIVARYPKGCFDSIQIFHIELFRHILSSRPAVGRVIRTESFMGTVEIQDQVAVIPKREVCAHFDGYAHTRYSGAWIKNGAVPPLFIPEGFFNSKIRISYGYDEYREGWVNINPAKAKFRFESGDGTDLKLSKRDIPMFWKGRIAEFDSNPDADMQMLEESYERRLETVRNPWPGFSAGQLRIERLKGFLEFAINRFANEPAASLRKTPRVIGMMIGSCLKK